MIRCAKCEELILTTVSGVTIIGTDVRHLRCSPPDSEIVYIWGHMTQRCIEEARHTTIGVAAK